MNKTHPVAPPWGYGLLFTQDQVEGQWIYQLFTSIVVGAYYWDTMISFITDCEFVFRRKFNYVTIIFITNRIACTFTLTCAWLVSIYKGNHCYLLLKLLVYSEPVTITTSGALLLLRVRVLYKNNPYILIFLVLLLISGPVLAFAMAFITFGFNLPGNVGCGIGSLSPYIYLVFILQALFDCICFILSVYKLYNIGKGNGFMSIGKEMLNGGMAYYIPNVIAQIATICLTVRKGSAIHILAPPMADGIASAQSLRITRNLWKKCEREAKQRENPGFLNSFIEGSTGDTSATSGGRKSFIKESENV